MARLALAVLAILFICVTTQIDAAPLQFFTLANPDAANDFAEGTMVFGNILDFLIPQAKSAAANDLAEKLQQTFPDVLWNSGAAIANLVDFPTPEPNVFSDGLDVIKNVNQLSYDVEIFPSLSYDVEIFPSLSTTLSKAESNSINQLANSDAANDFAEALAQDVSGLWSGDQPSGQKAFAGIQVGVPMLGVSPYFQKLEGEIPGPFVNSPTPGPNVISDGQKLQQPFPQVSVYSPTPGPNVISDGQKLQQPFPQVSTTQGDDAPSILTMPIP